MAATIAVAKGFDKNRVKEVHRLGHAGAQAMAATWRTFATCQVDKDGSVWVSVLRDDKVIHRFELGPEK